MGETRKPRRFWPTCRVYFRRLRITILLVILLLTAALLYVNQVGLPDFVKQPLLEELRARGLDLQFSRLRLSWYRGIVAENVQFGPPQERAGPHMTAREVGVQLNPRALRRFQVQVEALAISGGRLVWPIHDDTGPNRELSAEDIRVSLRFLAGDEWVLEDFHGVVAGADIRMLGTVGHASELARWNFGKQQQPTVARAWEQRLRRFSETLERITFHDRPDLRLEVHGDARDLGTFGARLMLRAPAFDSPWGTFRNGRLTGRVYPMTNAVSQAIFSLEAREAETPWGNTSNFQLEARLVRGENQTNIVEADIKLNTAVAHTRWAGVTNLSVHLRAEPAPDQADLVSATLSASAQQATTRWAEATNLLLSAEWTHSLNDPVPVSGMAEVSCDAAESSGITGKAIKLMAHLLPGADTTAVTYDPSWSFWTNLAPFAFDWDCRVGQLAWQGYEGGEVRVEGLWHAPNLTVSNLHAALYEGKLDLRAKLDVASRAAAVSLVSDFDPHSIAPLLGPAAEQWLGQFEYKRPPHVAGDVSLVLPAWTDRHPDWRAEVQPSLKIQGEVDMQGGGSFRKVPIDTAHTHLSYSNLTWRLPDLRISRPEGRVRLAHVASDLNRDFYWRVESTIDPKALAPVLGEKTATAMNIFSSEQPPEVSAEIWGRGGDNSRLGVNGIVAITNFTFRGESFSGLQTSVTYTNQVLRFLTPRAQRGSEWLSADSLEADFNSEIIFLTNGISTMDPHPVARAIGTNVGRFMEPYRWGQPPHVHVSGIIPMHGEEQADLLFNVEGKFFRWLNFNIPEIAGSVHWAGLRVDLSNLKFIFYGGRATGAAILRFPREQDTTFEFSMTTTNTQLEAMMADVNPGTNHLEGLLSGTLIATRGITRDWSRIDGYGNLTLKDGLIWDIPLFGVFTPMLNGISPGLGRSRASAATCTFVVTNGVFKSEDMEIRCTGMRMHYRGTIDVEGQVRARVDAAPLRDMWVVGPIVSTVLWPVSKVFEYKVTGPLRDLKTEPLFFIPKIILLPFRPLKTLKEIFQEEQGSGRFEEPPKQ